MRDFEDRVAVVTGAANGIGLALADRFVAERMKVVLADVDAAALEREVTRLSTAGADVRGELCDVREYSAVTRLAERTLSHFGGIDVIVNNAGVLVGGPILDNTPADWRWIVDVNVLGVAHGVSAFGPILRDQNAGHIVNTASEVGLVATSALGVYAASKHAVVGLSESLYHELRHTGVSVHCLCPNLVRTEIFASERNRDDGELRDAGTELTLLREAVDAQCIEPSQVAGDVMDAMRADRFWVFTHEITREAATVRLRDIEADRNPTPPYASA